MTMGGSALRLTTAAAVLAGGLVAGSALASGGTASRNLLQGDSASFGSSIGGWSSTDAALSRDGSTYHSGPGSLLVQPRLAIQSGPLDASSPGRRARPGHIYSGSAYTSSSSLSSKLAVGLAFVNDRGRVLDTTYGAQRSGGSKWRLQGATAVAPARTRKVRLVVRVTGPGASAHVDDAALLNNGRPASSKLHAVRVRRDHIVDGAGHRVLLRGVERVGLEQSADNAMTKADVIAFKHWGANVVRLPLSPNFWLRGACDYQRGYRQHVEDIVRMLTARHIVTMLQLHTTKQCGSTGKPPMPDETKAIPFWRQVARDFRGNPLVTFDLYNEPHDVTQAVWLHGGHVNWEYDYRAAGMQEMYDAVRAVGARNLVFVAGMGWGSVPPTQFVQGHNIAYAAHAYTCPGKPPPNCSYSGDVYDGTPLLKRWLDVARHHAVFVNEFGWPTTTDSGRFLRSVIRFSDRHGWGWVAYGFDGSIGDNFDLVGAKLGDGTYEPAPVGMPVVRDLARRR